MKIAYSNRYTSNIQLYTPKINIITTETLPFNRNAVSFCANDSNSIDIKSKIEGLNGIIGKSKEIIKGVHKKIQILYLRNQYSEIKDITKVLDKLQNYTINEYDALTENERLLLLKRYDKMTHSSKDCLYETEKNYDPETAMLFNNVVSAHDKTVSLIKKRLDEDYGEGQYVILIVGRSIASIGKCLGYRIGENNVVTIPMSNTDKYLRIQTRFEKEKNGGAAKLKEFLADNGITRENIQNSGQKYILMDYCDTGKSLRGAEKMLKSPKVLGKCNIVTRDICDCINDRNFKDYLWDILCDEKFKPLSLVKKCKDLRKISDSFVDTKTLSSSVKLLLFKLMDSQIKKNFLFF